MREHFGKQRWILETRTLIRVRIDDAAQAERRVTTLMGDKVEPRRKWIEQHVQFALEEDGGILDRSEEDTSTNRRKSFRCGKTKAEQTDDTEISLFDIESDNFGKTPRSSRINP